MPEHNRNTLVEVAAVAFIVGVLVSFEQWSWAAGFAIFFMLGSLEDIRVTIARK